MRRFLTTTDAETAFGELMADDDNQKQVERVLSRTVPEVEIPCPEPGAEMDVGEPTLHAAGPMEEQPVPTVRVDRQAQEPGLE